MPKEKKKRSKSKSKDKRSKSKKGKKSSSKKPPKRAKEEPSGQTIVQNMPQISSICVMHKAELSYYCETCEEPVCQLCITLGPHNNQLHRVTSIQKAYENRIGKMDSMVKAVLIQKRDQLEAQLYRLDYRMEEIKYVRGVIEQDAKIEFGGILERLKSHEGKKLSVLQHMMAEVQKDVDNVNLLTKEFTELTNQGQSDLNFMIKSPSIAQNIEFLLNKPFKREINVTPYDLPRELAILRKEVEECLLLEKLDKMKTEIIKNLFEVTKQAQKDVIDGLDVAANEELGQWAMLAEKYSDELAQFQLICYYCGCPLTNDSVNEPCVVNAEKVRTSRFKGFTVEKAPDMFNGTRRHFFNKPKMDIFESPQAFQNLQAIFHKGGNNPYKQTVKIQLEKAVAVAKKKAYEDNVELLPLFQQHDEKELGIINTIKFTYILNEFLGVRETDILHIVKVMDPSNKNLINYMEFVRLVHDPSIIEEMPFFTLNNETANQLETQAKNFGATDSDYGMPYLPSRLSENNKPPKSGTGAGEEEQNGRNNRSQRGSNQRGSVDMPTGRSPYNDSRNQRPGSRRIKSGYNL